ncbi:hypothetical protein Tco_0312928 [Tanacetum coccineum]
MSTPTFAETHNLVAFLEKPSKSKGFEQIIDFINASSIKYALTMNPTIYTSYVEQFWTSVKVKTINEGVWLQALVDEKKIIVNEASIRRDLRLDDAKGTACLPNATIFEELARMGAKTTVSNEFSSTMASAIICLAKNQKFNFPKYIFESMMKNLEGGVKFLMYLRFVQVFVNAQLGDMSHHKKIFVNMKRAGKDFSRAITPLFDTMMVQATIKVGGSKGRKLRFLKMRYNMRRVYPQLPMIHYPVLNLEEAKTAQAKEIASLKKRVKKLENKMMSRTTDLKILKKVGIASKVESSEDITLVDGAQEKMNDQDMFGVNDLDGDEVIIDDTAGEKEE